MRVKCDDCPCLGRNCYEDDSEVVCNLEADLDGWRESTNCTLIEVRYWKDGEVARFTPELVQNPANPRER